MLCSDLARRSCVDHEQIEVVDPNKYMLQNKIPFERQEPKDPPNQSPSLAFEVAT